MNNKLQANFRSNKNFDKGNLTRFFVCDVIFDSSNQLLPLSVKSISLSNRVVLLLPKIFLLEISGGSFQNPVKS